MIELTTQDQAVLIPVKIVPGASRTRYLGEWQGRAKVAVAAAPEKGRANKAVIAFFAAMFKVRQRDVSVSSGLTNPLKTIKIEGVQEEVVRGALEPPRS